MSKDYSVVAVSVTKDNERERRRCKHETRRRRRRKEIRSVPSARIVRFVYSLDDNSSWCFYCIFWRGYPMTFDINGSLFLFSSTVLFCFFTTQRVSWKETACVAFVGFRSTRLPRFHQHPFDFGTVAENFPFWTLVSFNLAHNFITSYKTNDLADMLYYIVIMVPRWLTRLAGMLRSSRNIFTWMVMTIEVYKQTTLSVIAYLPYFLHSSSFSP